MSDYSSPPGPGYHPSGPCGSTRKQAAVLQMFLRKMYHGSYERIHCETCGGWKVERRASPKSTELLDRAIAETGLEDFGDYNEVEAWLRLLLDEITTTLNVDETILRVRLHVSLTNRLRVAALPPRKLERAPILVIGAPRTGTTYLSDLLGLCGGVRPLLAHEARWPGSPDDRAYKETKLWFARTSRAIPDLAVIHPLRPDAQQDVYALLEHTLQSFSWGIQFPVRGYQQTVESEPFDGPVRFLRYALAGIDPDARWLLKESAHLSHLGAFLDGLPGLRVVWIHRDPVQSVPSLCSLLEAIHRTTAGGSPGLGLRELGYVATALEAAHRADRANPGRVLHVEYDDLVANPAALVDGLARELDLTPPDALPETPAREQHRYTPEQFGLTADLIRGVTGGLR